MTRRTWWRRAVGCLVVLGRVAFLHLAGAGVTLGMALGADSPVVAKGLQIEATGVAGFTRLTPDLTGVAFTNRLSDDAAAENQIRLNGSGVALGDIDGDGRVDVFLCGLETPNRLYRNLGGLRFEESGRDSAIAMPGSFSTGAAFADVDGDGDLDLLVNAIGEGTRLFLNDGRGAFVERADAGLQRKGGATSLTLADIDGDGDLDLYVANYRTTTIRTTGFALLNTGGKRVLPPELRDEMEITAEGKVLEHGEQDFLYLNDGTGRFTLEPWTRGRFLDENGEPLKKAPRDWGLAAMFRDINQDGFPDLYVANDFHSPDRLWLNDGTGHFQAAPRLSLRQTSTFSMSVDFGDLDRDGWDDFFLSDMLDPRRERRMAQHSAVEPNVPRIGVYEDRPQQDRNTLFWNRGDGTYAEIAYFAGIEAAGWSWSVAFIDVDLDGFEDMLLTTGHMFDTQDLDSAAKIERMGPFRREQIPRKLLLFPRLQMPKAAFRNLGGMRFADAADAWKFNDVGVAHGMALADLDGDGDLDVVVNNLNAAAGIYRNDSPAPRVAVRLRGAGRNTHGIGARIQLRGASGFTQSQEIQAGGRYLSGDAPLRVFAWPRGTEPARLTVAWRSGKTSTMEGVRSNQVYEITEPPGAAPAEPDFSARQPPTGESPGLFVDSSNAIDHRHVEAGFDDFERQPLLPRKLSQAGPGLAWCDLDGDGWEDLVVGGGRGGAIACFRNNQKGGFSPTNFAGFANLDRAALALVAAPFAEAGLLVAFSNYEADAPPGAAIRHWDFRQLQATNFLSDLPSSVGAMAVADIDADGDLDLFVAGRCIPGRYPEPASSTLLRNDGGRFVPDAGALFAGVGLITGAAWSDLDGDGFPELVLSSEWGPVRIYHNDAGRLKPWDPEVEVPGHNRGAATRLSSWTGWWTTIVTADFDGDGRMDVFAGNWGLNSRYHASPEHPVRIWYGDLDESGSVDIFETYFDTRLAAETPERDLVALRNAVPGVMARFGTHTAYARASIAEVLGDAIARARKVEAGGLASVLFLNRGDRFEARPLPDQAQWSPVMGGVAGDFDGDGAVDLFLAQNCFAVQPTLSRCDAGRGLLLRNDGHGNFTAMRGEDSGIFAYGEQRGCAAADFDGDGRLDLVVGQNGAETKLFRNGVARPGLRVRVRGGKANPLGIGTRVQWVLGDRRGAALEVQAGSGGMSQNSLVGILTGVPDGAAIEALWPGGRKTTTRVQAGAREITVAAP